MTEIELKFLLDEQVEKRLRGHPALRRMTRGRASTGAIRTIYHDTEDWRLRAAGIALRLREEGGRWVQTVKLGRSLTGGLSRAHEVEVELEEGRLDLQAIPDAELRARILAATDGQVLKPVAETRLRRTRRLLDHAGSLIEFALDSGQVVAGERSEPLREAEFELIEGDPNALFDAAAAVFDAGPVRFSERSKAERGHLLAMEGRIAALPGRRKAAPVALDPGMSTDAAAQAVLAECLEQVARNARLVVESDDSAGPHQLRVGLRRLRTALGVLPKEHRPPRVEFLVDEARRIGRAAGTVRDLDVMAEALLGPAAQADPLPGWERLERALAARATPARKALRAILRNARTQRFLIELAAAAAGVNRPRAGELGAEHLAQPVGRTMRDALDRAWKKLKKRARGIENLSAEDRHALRKTLKRLRYTVEFGASLYPADRVRPFRKRLKALQDVFGELNDLAMAERLLTGDDAPGRSVPEAQFAAGVLIGGARVRAERQWEDAKAAWQALRKKGPFW